MNPTYYQFYFETLQSYKYKLMLDQKYTHSWLKRYLVIVKIVEDSEKYVKTCTISLSRDG